jgi:opacity protein-like surface antigen
MKKIALVAIVLTSSTAFAQTLGDLNFFQKKGSIYYQGSIGASSYTYMQKSVNQKHEQEGLIFKNQISFGLLDNLNVFVEASYKLENNLRIEGAQDHEDNGLTNPGVGANYRLVTGPTFVDLFGKLNARIQDAEVGSARKDGNAASAPDFALTIGGAVGQKLSETTEFRLAAGAIHSTEGEYKVRGAANKTDTDSKTDLFLAANYQMRPVSPFMIDLGYRFTRVGEYTEKSAGLKTVADAHNSHIVSFKAKYHIFDGLLATLYIDNGILPNYDLKEGGVKDEIKRQKYSAYGLGLDLLF